MFGETDLSILEMEKRKYLEIVSSSLLGSLRRFIMVMIRSESDFWLAHES